MLRPRFARAMRVRLKKLSKTCVNRSKNEPVIFGGVVLCSLTRLNYLRDTSMVLRNV